MGICLAKKQNKRHNESNLKHISKIQANIKGINFRERFKIVKFREYCIKAFNESNAFSPMQIVTIIS
jgi:hypothetical protein